MKLEEIRKYTGKKVLIVLKNNFKYSTVLPMNIDETFTIIDRYGNELTIDCFMVGMIMESEQTNV